MSARKVTPFRPPPEAINVSERNEEAQQALIRALAILDILQGAAAFGAIEPPSNEESLAQTLDVVRDLIEEAQEALWPREVQEAAATSLETEGHA